MNPGQFKMWAHDRNTSWQTRTRIYFEYSRLFMLILATGNNEVKLEVSFQGPFSEMKLLINNRAD